MKLVLCALFSTISLFSTPTHPPFNEIKTPLPFFNQGSCSEENQFLLRNLINSYQITTVIEIGSFLGKSTIPIAQTLPSHGKLYAIDHWLGSVNDPTFSGFITDSDELWNQFLSNIIRTNLTDKVIPIKTDSITAALIFNSQADLVYIDASHDLFPLYTNLHVWYPHLNREGILCGNDWSHPSVQNTVVQFANNHPELALTYAGNFYCLYKSSSPPQLRF